MSPCPSREPIQFIIDADIFPTLIHFLSSAEFDIRKEAAWAVSNATSGGSPDQLIQLVRMGKLLPSIYRFDTEFQPAISPLHFSGCIKPLCDLLEVKDNKVVTVALEALENILRVGEHAKQGEFNEMATLVDEADGVNKIQALQYHASEGIIRRLIR